MSKSAYGAPRCYKIFAIITTDDVDNRVAFIGKTVADLRQVLRRHQAGKNKLTAEDFRYNAYEKPATIHQLQVVYGDAAYAYRHVVCWLRRFDDANYVTLTYQGTEYAAYHMLPQTAAIYQQILTIPLEPLLAKPYEPPPKHSPKALPNPKTTASYVQLNVRVDRSEYDAFCTVCENSKLTQREGIVMLLSEHDPAASDHLILEQKDTITKQLEVIRSLNKKAARLPCGANADINLKNALEFCRAGIARYIELFIGTSGTQEPKLQCLSWNHFDASGYDRRSCSFPENGYSIIKLEAMCYGQGRRPAIFLWGINVETNRPIKLRFYKKTNYIGLPIPHSGYLRQGSMLFVAHKTAKDGAADLHIALPLPVNTQLWQESCTATKEKPSLDDLILNASKNKVK